MQFAFNFIRVPPRLEPSDHVALTINEHNDRLTARVTDRPRGGPKKNFTARVAYESTGNDSRELHTRVASIAAGIPGDARVATTRKFRHVPTHFRQIEELSLQPYASVLLSRGDTRAATPKLSRARTPGISCTHG